MSPSTFHIKITKPNDLMLYREAVTVYCRNHTAQMHTLCGQNAEFFG
jgi:hypothetical protein